MQMLLVVMTVRTCVHHPAPFVDKYEEFSFETQYRPFLKKGIFPTLLLV
jgi:hypothetical protein